MLSDLIGKEKGYRNAENTSENESNNEESSSDIENHEGEEEVRGTQRQFLENHFESVRKTIWDLEFSEQCCKISWLPASPRIFEHLKNGIIVRF